MQSKNTIIAYIGLAIVFVGFIQWGIYMQIDAYSGVSLGVGALLLLVYIAQNTSFLITKLTGRSAAEGANLAVSVFVFLAIAIFAYLLLKQHNVKFDFTKEKKFTLASQTVQLVQNLKEDILVQYLASPNSPAPAEQARVKDLLALYSEFSSKFTFEVVDPQSAPEKVRGLNPDRYGPVYVRLGEQHEKVDPVNEENLTNALIKINQGASRLVYFTSGHGEPSIEDQENSGLLGMKTKLEDQGFEVKAIALYEQDDIPDDCAAIIIAGPQRPFLANEVEAIKRFLDKGGDAMFLIDPETQSGLESMIRDNLGLVLGNDYVVENNAFMRALSVSPIHPMMSKIEEHPIMDAYKGQAQAIMFPKARSITLSDDVPAELEITELIKTSENSWAETNIKDLFDPSKGTAGFDDGEDIMGPITLAAAASKAVEIESATEPSETDEPETDENVEMKDEAPQMRVVVFGDSDFIINKNYLTSSDLLINSVNWMVQQEDMISIRPKDDSGTPIVLDAEKANVIFYMTLIVFPLMVALFGFFMVMWKRVRG
ncbi:MAG: Gldg family protein [Candidatus Hinthialibacter antarcticus]|nr:Gldg family protein [Candidatus Hinthialibacter antarcticus]